MDRRKVLQQTGLLAGASILMPSMVSLFQSCETVSRSDWKPLFFNVEESHTVSALLDMILPRTETLGALDVKADIFIDKVFAETYDKTRQENIRAEITAFNANCKKKLGTIFIGLSEADRNKVLQEAEATSEKFNPGVWGTSVGKQKTIGFYRSIKSMAIWAYFTSEEIGEKVLNYDPNPGSYEPCKPLSEVDNRSSL